MLIGCRQLLEVSQKVRWAVSERRCRITIKVTTVMMMMRGNGGGDDANDSDE